MNTVAVLGQTYHTHTGTAAITPTEVTTEMRSRGYSIQAHVPVPEPHEPARITRIFAIKVAVDHAIEAFGLPRSSTHFYRCPYAGCPIREPTWNSIITWTTSAANAYFQGAALPSWASSMWHSGATLHGFALGSLQLSGWFQDNPWFVSALGDVIKNYGEYLTAKQVKDAIEQNAPKGMLTKDDIPALIAALQQKGAIAPGQEAAVAQGAQAAVSSSWIMPVAIVGGVLAVMLLMRK